MSRAVINRVLDANAFYLHFEGYVGIYNRAHNSELRVGKPGIITITNLLRSPLLKRYGHFSRADLILNYRKVVSDIAFMMFAAIDDLFDPRTRGNYTDARFHVLMEYIFQLMRECSADRLAPAHDVSSATMIAAGQRFKLAPAEAWDYIANIDLQIDEYRALEND